MAVLRLLRAERADCRPKGQSWSLRGLMKGSHEQMVAQTKVLQCSTGLFFLLGHYPKMGERKSQKGKRNEQKERKERKKRKKKRKEELKRRKKA